MSKTYLLKLFRFGAGISGNVRGKGATGRHDPDMSIRTTQDL